LRALIALLIAAGACLAQAATFRWASQGDYLTADPHSQDALLTNAINFHVYEPLVMRGKKLELLPALAVSWKQAAPTTWVFTLRKGVKWHDGSDFTADDVVFSVKRAQGPTSNFRTFANAVGEPRRIDDHTVAFVTPVPNPVLVETIAGLTMMSRAWCRKHKAEAAQNFAASEESYTTRHAMGTGAFQLVSRIPDGKSTFRKNPQWWGIAAGMFEGNVDVMEFATIRSDATRMAALLSGELELVHDPPPQDLASLRRDPRVRIHEGPENSIVFLGMDQSRDALLYSDVKDRNPFKDRRVRLAVYQAIDNDALNRVAMRGMAISTGVALTNPAAAGIPKEMNRRHPHDVEAARKLLAAAGYPNGFGVTLDCLNTREKFCVALAGMLARVNIRVSVNSLPGSQFIAKGQRMDTSFYMLGWGGAATDAIFLLLPVFHGRNAQGDGDSNWGNYRDEKLDSLIDRAKVETDPKKRQALINEAMQTIHENVYYIPLHHRISPWVSRANVEVVHRANNHLQAIWVNVR
jgi:peptide/nickel transport system substrate-binding protein